MLGISQPTTPTGAILSSDGQYRYRLWRIWEDGKPLLNIIGLNPSTADATGDDPTMRRCVGFAEREGFGGLVMTNLFAYRATDPNAMMQADDPVGPENDLHVREVALQSAQVLLAWGNGGLFLERATQVLGLLQRECQCLGITALGEPRHPLYLRKDEPMSLYPGSISGRFPVAAVIASIEGSLQELSTSLINADRPGWTRLIRSVFEQVAIANGYEYAPSGTTGEWLYDHVWYRVASYHGVERTVCVPLVMECEWHNSLSAIAEDFDKLLVSNAELRVLVCGWYKGFAPAPVIAYCEAAVRGFQQLAKGAQILLCFIPEEEGLGQARSHRITK
jgi:hypothetical protein